MSVQQRRKYDPDFKRNAVQLTEEPGRTVSCFVHNKNTHNCKQEFFTIAK